MDTKPATMMDTQKKPRQPKDKDIIAFRKKCSAEGTGLSHYILISEKAKH
ncbi:MAG: modified peptide precursor CbpA [Humidesulfovibrio sp.]|nr:modified peptide precursor CbpA [Humidesulfovibrio sp.]